MVTEIKELQQLIQKALDDIGEGQQKLVSYTKKVEQFDAIHFFQAVRKSYTKSAFWHTADNSLTLVAAGELIKVNGNGKKRIEQTKAALGKMFAEAVTYCPVKKKGTGLLVLGGMNFDSKQENGALWKDFPDSEFFVPEFLFSQLEENDYYLTTNLLVRHKDHADTVVKEYMKKEAALWNYPICHFTDNKLINEEEVATHEWKNVVQRAKNLIREGIAEKIVLARELRIKAADDFEIAHVLKRLLQTQANSYVFAYVREKSCFIGATPERLVRVENEQLLTTCLAGSAPRGKTPDEDEQIRYGLLQDPKNIEEHQFVVKMIKESIAPYCKQLNIPKKPVVYPLKNIQHLYTPVTAKLEQHFTIFDIVQKLHPTPALGGTPTETALAFIREQEPLNRGWYGAPIGWVDQQMNGEFAVAIRSGLISGNEASIFAGCGIVKDSDIEAEFEETSLKFLPMQTVLGGK
ncbi:isochorismate synthase MenF [Virgibacillus soli]|uniref:Isochorismate synthase MenF n=1 Tax=Paracerasibacillus soli TaxID=480284 RepID=A0ABU5CQU7_9BACI|nr:isochorismate synthase [Virgibacillus soli]MDY0408756.1 isochorismate synthase [Virgibacillus soli]